MMGLPFLFPFPRLFIKSVEKNELNAREQELGQWMAHSMQLRFEVRGIHCVHRGNITARVYSLED